MQYITFCQTVDCTCLSGSTGIEFQTEQYVWWWGFLNTVFGSAFQCPGIVAVGNNVPLLLNTFCKLVGMSEILFTEYVVVQSATQHMGINLVFKSELLKESYVVILLHLSSRTLPRHFVILHWWKQFIPNTERFWDQSN